MEGPRACKPEELKDVVEFINSIFRPDSDQSIDTDYPLIFNLDKLDYMRIIKTDGKIASHVPVAHRHIITPTDQFAMGIISPTGTHPDHRHKGYGTLCLNDCVSIMENNHWPISVLWTQEQTFPFYQNSGWEGVKTQGKFISINPSDHKEFKELGFEVSRLNDGDQKQLNEVISIHKKHPYTIERSEDDYKTLFNLHKIETWIASAGGKVAGYMVYANGSNKSGIIETGGNVKAIETILNNYFAHNPQKSPQALLPLFHTNLESILQSRLPKYESQPIEIADSGGYMMIRINSLIDFINSIKKYLDKKANDTEGTFSLKCKETKEIITVNLANGKSHICVKNTKNALELTRRQLTQLFFGSHPDIENPNLGPYTEILSNLFPYYFHIWELDHS